MKKSKFLGCFGNEKYQAVTIPIFAILISLIVGAVLIVSLGKNPLADYQDRKSVV